MAEMEAEVAPVPVPMDVVGDQPPNDDESMDDNADVDEDQQADVEHEEDEAEEEDEDEDEERPEQKFQVRQRVYARDDKASGILYESVVRRAMYGLRQKQINVYLVNPDDPNAGKIADQDEDEEEYCWHYFVHYQGWNVKWDRWVEESSLYVASDASKQLAQLLKKELDKIVKLQKGGRGGNDINAIRRRMAQLEDEFREEERREELRKQGLLPPVEEEEKGKEKATTADDDDDVQGGEGAKKDDKANTIAKGTEQDVADDETNKVQSKGKEQTSSSDTKKRYTKAVLEKEKKLRRKNLEGKLWRKQAHAQKIVLPFTLKKLMVEEWEIITLCGMVPRLPSNVPIRQVLDRFLESKLELFRPAADGSSNARDANVPSEANQAAGLPAEQIDSSAGTCTEEKKEEEDLEAPDVDEAAEIQAMENAELEAMAEDEETRKKKQEWVDMVNGVMQFFDEALPVHLLYQQERTQHKVIMRSDDPLLEGKLPSEIYGCEYLLRMLVQFPTLLSESGLPASDERTILSKMNDLLRFFQKHQSEFFSQTYRKPVAKELRKRIARKPKKIREDLSSNNGADDDAATSEQGGEDMSAEEVEGEADGDDANTSSGKKRGRTSDASESSASTPPSKATKKSRLRHGSF